MIASFYTKPSCKRKCDKWSLPADSEFSPSKESQQQNFNFIYGVSKKEKGSFFHILIALEAAVFEFESVSARLCRLLCFDSEMQLTQRTNRPKRDSDF